MQDCDGAGADVGRALTWGGAEAPRVAEALGAAEARAGYRVGGVPDVVA